MRTEDGRNVADFNWHVRLIIDNDEGLQNMVMEHAKQVVEDEGEDLCKWALAEYLRDLVEELCEVENMVGGTMLMELTMSAIQSIDFDALSASYLEDAQEAIDYDNK